MSIVDELDLNEKFRLVLMATIDITDPERHEKALNACNGISGAQLRKLLAFFNLNDVAKRDLGNMENIWGVFQAVRKARGTDEYIRDQIQIVINVGETRTARIYVRGVRHLKEQVVQELEKIRNVTDLLALLGPVEDAKISRRKFSPAGDRKKTGGPNQPRSYGDKGGQSHQPFTGLRDKLEGRGGRGERERGSRRHREDSVHA